MTTSNQRTADHAIDRQFLDRWSPRAFTDDTLPQATLLTFLDSLSGWKAHGLAGIERERIRSELAIPDDYAIEAALAIGRAGDPAQLNETLRARELPNGRLPLAAISAEGAFAFTE
ncbi:hypothetical protein AB4Y42_13260 [Paraburkholderia sp. EG286B]|uniref:hypothetical protein n=1 Tax=Paraburkholderia sp. EG286B TaxID=3237011 RepID=UPI0034D19974